MEQGVLEGPVGCLNVKGAQAKTRIIVEGLKMWLLYLNKNPGHLDFMLLDLLDNVNFSG